MNEGSYQSLGALNRTVFEALNSTSVNAPRCQKLDSATCFRSRQTLGKAFATIQAAESSVAKASSRQVQPARLSWLPLHPVWLPCSTTLLAQGECSVCLRHPPAATQAAGWRAQVPCLCSMPDTLSSVCSRQGSVCAHITALRVRCLRAQNALLQATAEASGSPAGGPSAAPAGEEVTAVGGRRLKGWKIRSL